MEQLKEKLTSTFEKVQYDTEDLISNLQERIDNSEAREQFMVLKNSATRKISNDLSKARKELRQLKDATEIDAYLDDVREGFDDFVTRVRSIATDLDNGIDVSSVLEDLKTETSGVMGKVETKVKDLAKDAKLEERFAEAKDKGADAISSIKEKAEDLTKDVQGKSESLVDKIKEKLGK